MQIEIEHLVIAVVFTLAGAGIVLLGFSKLRNYRLIKDTPRSKVRSIAIGLVEVHGKVACYMERFIKAPFSGQDCLFYKYEIEEYRKESGKKKHTYRWKTVGFGQKGTPFLATDETGEVLVDPIGVEAELSKSRRFYQDRDLISGSLGSVVSLVKALRDFDADKLDVLADLDRSQLRPVSERGGFGAASPGDRRCTEYYIDPGDSLFLLGTATVDDNAPGGVIICRGRNEKTFLLSDREEKGVLSKLLKAFWVASVFGLVFFLVGVYMLLKVTNSL